MKVWRYSALDSVMLLLSIAHLGLLLLLSIYWTDFSTLLRATAFAALTLMLFYNIVVITHFFTHTPWFESGALNAAASVLNSINIAQSVQAYQFMHVRNHHRYNNDRKGPDGRTSDTSSTFLEGKGGEHAGLFRYAVGGALSKLVDTGEILLQARRLWVVTDDDLVSWASSDARRGRQELRQIQLDRMAQSLALLLFLAISWRWTMLCYLPALFTALVLVNVQNYFEHFGARPEDRYANSVSYYGCLYNLLTFNDGYHQEHHLRPRAHWSKLPMVRRALRDQLGGVERVVSPVPAVLGFLHRNRPLLHRQQMALAAPSKLPAERGKGNADVA